MLFRVGGTAAHYTACSGNSRMHYAFFSEMLLPEVNRWPLASHVVKGCKH